eukprot:PhM_4_TR12149/c0_g1_i1/m.57745
MVLVHFILDGDLQPFTHLDLSALSPLSLVRQSLSTQQHDTCGRLADRRWAFTGVDISLATILQRELDSLLSWIEEQDRVIHSQRTRRNKNPDDPELLAPNEFFSLCNKVSAQKVHADSLREHIIHTQNKVEGWRTLQSLFPSVPRLKQQPPLSRTFTWPCEAMLEEKPLDSAKARPHMSDLGHLITPISGVLRKSRLARAVGAAANHTNETTADGMSSLSLDKMGSGNPSSKRGQSGRKRSGFVSHQELAAEEGPIDRLAPVRNAGRFQHVARNFLTDIQRHNAISPRQSPQQVENNINNNGKSKDDDINQQRYVLPIVRISLLDQEEYNQVDPYEFQKLIAALQPGVDVEAMAGDLTPQQSAMNLNSFRRGANNDPCPLSSLERIMAVFLSKHESLIRQKDELGRTPLHHAVVLWALGVPYRDEAASSLRVLLKKANTVLVQDWRGWTVAHLAAHYDLADAVDMILNRAKELHELMPLLSTRDREGKTLLSVALGRRGKGKAVDVSRVIIRNGGFAPHLPAPLNLAADLDSAVWRDLLGSALDPVAAIERDDVDDFALIVTSTHWELNAEDPLGLTLVEHCAIRNAQKCCTFLIRDTNALVTPKALVLAVTNHRFEMLQNLLLPVVLTGKRNSGSSNGCQNEHKRMSDEGLTHVLRTALTSCRTERDSVKHLDDVVLALLEKIAPGSVPLNGSPSVIHLCMLRHMTNTVAIIFKRLDFAPDSVFDKIIGLVDVEGDTILGAAIRSGFTFGVAKIMQHPKLKRLAVIPVSAERTPLLFAVERELTLPQSSDPGKQRPFCRYRLQNSVTRILLQDPSVADELLNTAGGIPKRTPLQAAVSADSWHVACMLLSFGARVRPQTSLLMTASDRSVPLVQLLLANASESTANTESIKAILSGSESSQRPDVISSLTRNDTVDLDNSEGHDLLLMACEKDALSIVDWMLTHNVQVVGSEPHHVHTPLQILLQHHVAKQNNKNNNSAGYRAALVWRLLMAGSPPGVTTPSYDCGAISAVRADLGPIVHFMISKCGLMDILHEKCRAYKRSLLHWCVVLGNQDLARVIIRLGDVSSALVDCPDALKRTPLMDAVSRRDFEVCCALLATGQVRSPVRLCHTGTLSRASACTALFSVDGGSHRIPDALLCNDLVAGYFTYLSKHSNRSSFNAATLLDSVLSNPNLVGALHVHLPLSELIVEVDEVTKGQQQAMCAVHNAVKQGHLLVAEALVSLGHASTPRRAAALIAVLLEGGHFECLQRLCEPLSHSLDSGGACSSNTKEWRWQFSVSYAQFRRGRSEQEAQRRMPPVVISECPLLAIGLCSVQNDKQMDMWFKLASSLISKVTADVVGFVTLTSATHTTAAISLLHLCVAGGEFMKGTATTSARERWARWYLKQRMEHDPDGLSFELSTCDHLGLTVLELALRREMYGLAMDIILTPLCNMDARFTSSVCPPCSAVDGLSPRLSVPHLPSPIALEIARVLCQRYPTSYLSAVMRTAQFGLKNVKMIIDLANPWGRSPDAAESVLHVCARLGKAELLEYLCRARVSLDVSDDKGRSPLLLACRYGKLECVKILVRCGASTDVTDSCNQTILMHSILSGRPDVVAFVLSRIEKAVVHHLLKLKGNVTKSTRATPIEAAVMVAARSCGASSSSSCADEFDQLIVSLLKRAPVQLLAQLIASPSDARFTIWHGCARAGALESLRYLCAEAITLCLNPSMLDASGLSALDVARAYHDEESAVVSFLKESVPGIPQELWLNMTPTEQTVRKAEKSLKLLYTLGSVNAIRKMLLRNHVRKVDINTEAWECARRCDDTGLLRALKTGKHDWRRLEILDLPTFDFFKKYIEASLGGKGLANEEVYLERLRSVTTLLFSGIGGLSRLTLNVGESSISAVAQLNQEEEIDGLLSMPPERAAKELVIFYTHQIRLRRYAPTGPSYREDAKNNKSSLVHIACKNNLIQSVHYILKNNTVSGELRKCVWDLFGTFHDEHGYTACHYACALGHLEVVVLMFRFGVECKTPDGGTNGAGPLCYLSSPSQLLYIEQATSGYRTEDLDITLVNGSQNDVVLAPTVKRHCKIKPPYVGPGNRVVCDESKLWLLEDTARPSIDEHDHFALFLNRTAYKEFAIQHDASDVVTALKVRLTRDIYGRVLDEQIKVQAMRIRSYALYQIERLRTWKKQIGVVAKEMSRRESMRRTSLIMNSQWDEVTSFDHAMEYALTHQIPSVIDLTRIDSLLVEHVRTRLGLELDAASIENCTSPGDVARAKSILAFDVLGGPLGRALCDIFHAFLFRFGDVGHLCFLRIHALRVVIVGTVQEAALDVNEQGHVLFLTLKIYPSPTELIIPTVIEKLAQHFMLEELFLYRRVVRRVEALGLKGFYFAHPAIRMFQQAWYDVQNGRVLEFMDSLHTLRKSPLQGQFRRLFTALLDDVFAGLEDDDPKKHFTSGYLVAALRRVRSTKGSNNFSNVVLVMCELTHLEHHPLAFIPSCDYAGLGTLREAASLDEHQGIQRLLDARRPRPAQTQPPLILLLPFSLSDTITTVPASQEIVTTTELEILHNKLIVARADINNNEINAQWLNYCVAAAMLEKKLLATGDDNGEDNSNTNSISVTVPDDELAKQERDFWYYLRTFRITFTEPEEEEDQGGPDNVLLDGTIETCSAVLSSSASMFT